ncbi:MAG TPA: prolyl oligopeptidase family serine peptidase [Thermotogota bacterium]|nr:prolyl oligopeptidase family serine peptidase [Thermotogota bacterium]
MFKYPKTKKVTVEENHFGRMIPDPYRWMEDENDPELMSWIEEQNKLTYSILDRIPERESIRKRLKELYNFPKYHFTLIVAGTKIIYGYNDGLQNQDVFYIQEGLNGKAEILLDPNTLSEDGTVAVTLNGHSKDNKYLAILQANSGSDWQTLRILDLDKREFLPDQLAWIKWTYAAWCGDGFFYSGYDKPEAGKELTAKNENMKVYYHKLGDDQRQDKLIYMDEAHPLRYHTVMTNEDRTWLILNTSEGTSGNQVMIRKTDAENEPFEILFKGFDNEYEYIGSEGDRLFFLTNEGASNKKIVVVNASTKTMEDLVTESEDALENAYKMGDDIMVHYLKDVVSKAFLYDTDGKMKTEVQLPGIGTIYMYDGDRDLEQIILSYGSFTEPIGLYSVDCKTGETSPFKTSTVSFDASQFITEQLFCESKDGTKVPVFITRKKDLRLDGSNPTLLYAYGGFNISLPPSFDPAIIYLLENGGIYAQANLRGGAEYGEQWHKGGMLLNKQNVFDDFIAVAEALIEKGYTSSKKLAIQGGSNGGLLMGAVTNQRPDLFSTVFAQVGVMDMLRYHKFTIGWGWAVEYGNPDEESHFKNIVKYSPLHNIAEKDYPAVMVMTADHDDRVVPAHSFKYIATLQEKNTGDKPVIIRVATKAGHGAGKPITKIIDEAADRYAFFFNNMPE